MNLEQTRKKRPTADGDGGQPSASYPSARYFQVHFEHLESLIGELCLTLGALKEEVAALRQSASMRSFAVPAEDPDKARTPPCPLQRTGGRGGN
jgi:hypothetical protein